MIAAQKHQVNANRKILLLAFMASWYGACKVVSLEFKKQSKLPECCSIMFYIVDVDEAVDIVCREGITMVTVIKIGTKILPLNLSSWR
jgi:hypothetical protein